MMIVRKILRSSKTTEELKVLERRVMNSRTKAEVIEIYSDLTHTMLLTWHEYHNRQVGRIYKLICDKYLEVNK
jgi:hypothetical protein